MSTLYIDGFFVFGFVLTTTPVPGPSSPRLPLSLISVRADGAVRPNDIGFQPVQKSVFRPLAQLTWRSRCPVSTRLDRGAATADRLRHLPTRRGEAAHRPPS